MHIICTELPPNLNPPIFLFRPLRTKPPNLKIANISGYTVLHVLSPHMKPTPFHFIYSSTYPQSPNYPRPKESVRQRKQWRGGGYGCPHYSSRDTSVEGRSPKSMYFAHVFFVLKQEQYAFCFTNVQNSSTWGRNYKIRLLACFSSFSRWGTPPPLCLPR